MLQKEMLNYNLSLISKHILSTTKTNVHAQLDLIFRI